MKQFTVRLLSTPNNHAALTKTAVLELFYQATTIIACRAGNPASASYSRQALAALRIQSLLATEHPTDLPPLPVVPYAASLALSVAYRHLRKAEIVSRMTTALRDLRMCTEILEKLSHTWDSAVAMSRLGRKVLERTDGRAHYRSTASAPAENQRPEAKFDPQKHIPLNTENSLDILSTAAETHGVANLEPQKAQNVDAKQDMTRLGYSATSRNYEPIPLAGSIETAPLLAGSTYDDLDALFGDYLDVALPTNYDTTLFGLDDSFAFV